MRRRWPALAATIPLVLGWAVATAYPASASAPATGAVQPGGPVSSLSTPGMPSGTVTPQITGQQPQAVPGGGQMGGERRPERRRPGRRRPEFRRHQQQLGRIRGDRPQRHVHQRVLELDGAGRPLQWRGRQVRRVLGRARRLHQPHGRADRIRGRLLRVLPPVLRLVRGLPGRGGELHQPGQPRRPVHRHGHLHRTQHVQPGPQGQHQGLDADRSAPPWPARRGPRPRPSPRRPAAPPAAASCR